MPRPPQVPQRRQPMPKVNKNSGKSIELFRQGFALHKEGNLLDAKVLYISALKLNSNNYDANHLLGVIELHSTNYPAAIELINKAIKIHPSDPVSYYNLGIALKGMNQSDAAYASFKRAIDLRPDYVEAHYNLGVINQEIGRPDAAVVNYDKAIEVRPDYPDAYYNRGVALQELKNSDAALSSYDKAIQLKPDYAAAYTNRGNTLKGLRKFEEALASYDKSLEINPHAPDTYSNRGATLIDLNRLDEALESFNKALAIKSDYVDALTNKGIALSNLNRLEEALECYEKGLSINPESGEIYINKGVTLNKLNRLDEALINFDKAITLRPNSFEAYLNRGNSLKELHRTHEALDSFNKAIELKPDYAQAYNNRAFTYSDLQKLDESLESFDKALFLKPDYDLVFGAWFHIKMKLCDWSSLSDALERYEKGIRNRKLVTSPFPPLSLIDNPQLHKEVSRLYAEIKHPKSNVLGNFLNHTPNGKIRVGYYSADFHNHATAYLMAELFEIHDSEKFEFYAFSFGPHKSDEMRTRVSAAFDKFFDVRNMSDREVAKMSRDIEIDIAVDLKGYTTDGRVGVFAEGCAPIQVNYLGYPGTMGVDYYDYIIADKTIIPHEKELDYAEKVVRLPNSYQVNDSKRIISSNVFTKEEFNLPENSFVFCSFNNSYKILPSTFDGWMRILEEVPDSVLWLLEDNPTGVKNLRKEAELRGVDGARLIFAKRMILDMHLARHQLADLFIDTFPCNAHTTTSDSLWAGLPVLTLMGESFASRVAASLLHAVGLPELITRTQEEYESKAIQLAQNSNELVNIKIKLKQNKLKTPLFNGELFARHLESAYETMYRRHQGGLRPASFQVDP